MAGGDAASDKRREARAALVEKFRAVAIGRLERLSHAFIELERDPEAAEVAEDSMREIHTLKGEAKIVGFADVSLLAHKMEELILHAKSRGFRVEAGVYDLILRTCDGIAALLSKDAADRSSVDLTELTAAMDASLTPLPRAEPAAPRPARKAIRLWGERAVTIEPRELDSLTDLLGQIVQGHAYRESLLSVLARISGSWRDAVSSRAAGSSDGAARLAALQAELGSALAKMRELYFEDGLRIGELEERFREVRMLPLSTLFGECPRAARDLAREQGKEVRVEIRGEETRVDKRILEQMADPLLHMIRNAVDHGIETPAERQRAGKPAEGSITLSAEKRGSLVEVRVKDDGRGLDAEELRQAALAQGILKKDVALELDAEKAFELIFRPGFSTAHEVTEVSGRGVGLDVVKERIEGLGGSVAVSSEKGAGATFTLGVPVSAALIRVLLLEEGSVSYALPSPSVVSVARLSPEDIESTSSGDLFRWEGLVLPLADLSTLLGFTVDRIAGPDGRSVVILGHGPRMMGIGVERVVGERSVLQKETGRFLEGADLLAGTALLGDGSQVLVLSVPDLMAARDAGLPAERRTSRRIERSRVLVAEDSDITRAVITDVFRGIGCHVIEAVDGKATLARVAERAPDLILLDLDMPVLDGFEVLRRVRAAETSREVPVIVFTSHGSNEDKRRALELGADAYIVKSAFREADLVEKARRFLGGER